MLPRIHLCDPDIAVTIRANTYINSADAPMSEGYEVLKEKIESVYSCMGISCSQVRTRVGLFSCLHHALLVCGVLYFAVLVDFYRC